MKSEQGPPNFPDDPKRGMVLTNYGCGGCHLTPQIADAKGNVGPPLLHVGTRTYLAGFISNPPENMARWIQHPQKALPGNAMPEMGVTPQESREERMPRAAVQQFHLPRLTPLRRSS